MSKQRLIAYDEKNNLTHVYRVEQTKVARTLDGPVNSKGLARMYGPDNQVLTPDGGVWFRELFGNKRFRVVDGRG